MSHKNNRDKDIEKKTEQKSQPGPLQALALATTVGAQLAASVVLGFYGGMYLDRKFVTGPWLMLAGVILGIAAGIWGVYKTLMGFFRERE